VRRSHFRRGIISCLGPILQVRFVSSCRLVFVTVAFRLENHWKNRCVVGLTLLFLTYFYFEIHRSIAHAKANPLAVKFNEHPHLQCSLYTPDQEWNRRVRGEPSTVEPKLSALESDTLPLRPRNKIIDLARRDSSDRWPRQTPAQLCCIWKARRMSG